MLNVPIRWKSALLLLFIVVAGFIKIQLGADDSSDAIHPASSNDISPPDFLLGFFEDDYEITYSISASTWTQHPSSSYHIREWNVEEQYLLAQNDSLNASGAGLWTRIDWMQLEQMEPFLWAFCLSAYEATSMEEARNTLTANRSTPKTGCGSHPFSRMKPNTGNPTATSADSTGY